MSLTLYPAIDLLDGECVRLYLGDYGQRTVYDKNPSQVGIGMASDGAEWIHMVDLNGARSGKPEQTAIIVAVQKESRLKVQAGGGIRNQESARQLLQSGVSRVIIGSLAMHNPTATVELLKEFGAERLTLALDIRFVDGTPRLTSQGWKVTENGELWPVLEHYREAGFIHVLCTDVSKDGTLKGPNLDLYRELKKRFPTMKIQASGGISSLEDIRNLKSIGVDGAIVGKALYEGVFTLKEALAC